MTRESTINRQDGSAQSAEIASAFGSNNGAMCGSGSSASSHGFGNEQGGFAPACSDDNVLGGRGFGRTRLLPSLGRPTARQEAIPPLGIPHLLALALHLALIEFHVLNHVILRVLDEVPRGFSSDHLEELALEGSLAHSRVHWHRPANREGALLVIIVNRL
jgi:hypothetical protein